MNIGPVTKEIHQRIKEVYSKEKDYNISQRDRTFLEMRCGIGYPIHTLQEIGDKFGITKERVRMIEKRAIEKVMNVDMLY